MRKLYILFAACSISLVAYSQAPFLSTVVTLDNDANGRVDQLVLTFDIPIDQSDLDQTITSGSTTQFSVAGYNIFSVDTDTGGDSPIVEIDLVEGDSPDTDATPQIFIFGATISNLADDAFVGVLSLLAADGAAPIISEFVYSDANNDGTVDLMTLIYSEEIEGGSFVAEGNFDFVDRGDFDDFDFPPLGDDLVTGTVTSTQMAMIASSVQDTYDDSGDILISASGEFVLSDGSNTNSVSLQGQASYVDAAGPTLIAAVTVDSDGNGEIDQIELEFSENIDPTDLDQTPDGSGNTDQFDVHTPEYPISFVGTETGGSSHLVLIYLEEGNTPDTDATPTVSITTSSFNDASSNLNGIIPPMITTDGAAPVIYNAAMSPSNAYVEVVFSEPIERSEGGVLTLTDFDVTTSENVASLSILDAVTSTGGSPSSIESTLLFTLSVSPYFGDYDQENDYVVITPVNGLTLRESASTGANLAANSTENLALNDLLEAELPYIVNATWNTISNVPFLGYIDIEFNEPLFRDFENNVSPRLANTINNELNFGLYDGDYVNGSNTVCDAGELCITYTPFGSPVIIGNDNQNDIRLRGSDGLQILENDDYGDNVYRLVLFDISEPFTGIETYTFSPTDAAQIRGRTSGKFMPSDYAYTFNLPDLVPATFDNATFYDLDDNGIAEVVVVTLNSENFNDSTIEPSDFTMNGIELSTIEPDGVANDNSIRFRIDGLGLAGDEPFELTYTNHNDGFDLRDMDGNEIETTLSMPVVDRVEPVILTAQTVDGDRNGEIDAILLQFTEDINDLSLAAGPFVDFTVDGYTISGYDNSGPGNDNFLTLLLNQSGTPDSDVTPNITIGAGELFDVNVPANSLGASLEFIETTDGAGPAITSAVTDDTDGNGFIDKVTLTFSESIAGISATPSDDFGVTGYNILTSTFNGANTVQLLLTENVVPNYDTNVVPTIQLIANQIEDQAEGVSIGQAQEFSGTLDGAAPAIVEIEFNDMLPATQDGRIDNIQLRFSEPLHADSELSSSHLNVANASDFESLNFDDDDDDLISGGESVVGIPCIPSMEIITGESTPGTLAIETLSGFNLQDAEGNEYTADELQSHALIVDAARPIITDFEFSDAGDDGLISQFMVTFSEEIDGNASFLSSNNLVLSGVGNLVDASFGSIDTDRLVNGQYQESATPLELGNVADNISTGPTGLEITLENDGTAFIIQDLSGNQTTAGTLGSLVQDQATYTDGSVPVVISAVTADIDSDGMLDRIVLTLSEDIDINSIDPSPGGAGNTDQFLVADGYSISLVTTENGSDNSVIHINLDESGVPDSDQTPAVTILEATISDLSGNNFLQVTTPPATLDGAGPIIISATTVDATEDGHIDALDVLFDEAILDASLDMGPFNDFAVSGYSIIGYDTDPGLIGGGATNDAILRILLAQATIFDTDATPTLTMNNGEVEDGLNNSLENAQSFDQTTDGAAPVIIEVAIDDGTVTITPENEINAGETPTFSMTVSEPVTASIDISSLVTGKDSENMTLDESPAEGFHVYTYTPGENGALMNNTVGNTVQFTADDELNDPDVDVLNNISIDNVVPTVSIIPLETTETSPTITGFVADFNLATISLSINDGVPQVATNNNNGTWELAVGPLTPDIYDLDVTVVDPFENETSNTDDSNDELQIGGVAITAPSLINVCIDGGALELDPIVVEESKNNDFKTGIAGQTFFINLPDGFAFNTLQLPSSGGTHADISNIVYSYLGVQTLRVQLNIDNDVNDDEISIEGLQIFAVGTPATLEDATFATGTASIFGINDGDVMATLTSVDAPAMPNVSDQGPGGDPITEIEVVLGNDIQLSTSGGTNTFNWYDHDGTLIHVGPIATMSQLSVTDSGPTGFDFIEAGLYTIYVGEQNPLSLCESELRKVNIYLYNRQVTPQTFNFIETDSEGSQIIVDKNVGFSGVFFGPGLTNVTEDATHSFAQFIPSITGAGTFNITYQVENAATGESYDFVTIYNVSPGGSIFENSVEEEYCNADNLITMDVTISDVPEAPNFFFYGLRLRERGTATIVPDVLQPPAGWSELTFNSDQPANGWTIDPQDLDLDVGLYTIDRLIVPDMIGAGLGDLQVYNVFDIAFNATPVAVLNLPNEFVCEDDEQLLFTATLNGSLSVTVNEYLITDLTNANGQSVVESTFFNPGDPMGIIDGMGVPDGTYPVGQYSIDYTSNPLDDAKRCTDAADQILVTVLPKPDPVNLAIGTIREDRGELVNGVYTFEYCEGETIDPFEFSINDGVDLVTIYANSSLTSVLETIDNDDDGILTVTGIDMFGSSEAIGGTDADFHYVFELINQDGGCVANSIEVRYVVHEVPDNPIVDLNASLAGGLVSDAVYEFNYCSSTPMTSESLEIVTLNSLPLDGESYFNIYDEGGIEILHGHTSNEIDLTDPVFDLSLTPGSVNEFSVEEVNFDNSFQIPVPIEGDEFTGCTSSVTQVFINIHENPLIPTQADFSDNPHEVDGVIMYYLCQGDQLDFTINPPGDVNDYIYDWFEDELLADPVSVTDKQGDRLVSNDLADETFNFDSEAPGTYTMYTRLRSNVRVDAAFEGCASGLIQVDVVVFPQSIDPSVSAPTSSSAELSGGFNKVFDFCVGSEEGLPADTPFDTDVSFESMENLSEVQWYTANEDGTVITSFSPVAVGASITASNLGIQGVRDVSLSFAVVHNTDIVPGYGDFEGCFSSEVEFVQINVTTQPSPNFTFFGIGEGGPTTFNFIDGNLDEISDVAFEVRSVSDNSLEASFYESLNVNTLEVDFAPTLSAGIFEGTLTISTTTGCEQSLSRTFRIQELIQVSGLLEEHFDNNSGGWFAEFQQDNGLVGSISDPSSQRVSSWEHGGPDGITINSTWNNEGSAWTTTGNTTISDGSEVVGRYVASERSWVISPEYDLSTAGNPAISFLTYHDFELNAGVTFQYSLDRGDSWETLGNYDPSNPQDPSSGFGWYTGNGNPGAPGNTGIGSDRSGYNPERVAWSGQYTTEELGLLEETNGWKESIHSIGRLAGEPSVMFRFALSALGADTDDLTTNGFGFDELKIFELERNTIVEHFTTSVSNDDLLLTTDVYEIIDQTQSVGINYFTDLANIESSIDPINARNTPDPGVRAAYYGIGSSTTVLDGEVLSQSNSTESSFSLTDLERKRLQSVLFSAPIIENSSPDPGLLSLSASFTSRAEVENRDLSAIIAIVEREVIVSDLTGPIGLYKNGDVLKNVLRILLPNSAGHNVVGNIGVGEAITVEADWAVYNVYDPTKLRVIAFIQDNNTREILQSGYIDVSAAEIVAGIEFLDKFSISPIPADDHITIEIRDAICDLDSWKIFDMGGKQVSAGTVKKESRTLSIDTRSVQEGMYLLYLSLEEDSQSYPVRIIVEH